MADRPLIHPRDILPDIVSHFPLHGSMGDAERYGSGHINDTYVVTFDQAGVRVRYIVQRINDNIFKNVPALMENISRVTSHVATKTVGGDGREALTLVPGNDGLPFYKSPEGEFWRVYLFIEGARTYDALEDPLQAFEAARAFGRFQRSLADLPGGRLHETIPHFHDTPRRLEALRAAAEEDAVGRRKGVLAELDFAFAREADAGRLIDLVRRGDIPERVTHNDTKLNNVMLDNATGEGVCVIDLDTVMPGLSLYDFGDLVRFAANTAAEDQPDRSKIDVSLTVFETISRGYLAGAGDILSAAEWDNLAFAARLMTYEVGIRFLTDYLQGDIYFKTKHAEHNLDRARNQLYLVERMEKANDSMASTVQKLHDELAR